MLPQVSCTFHGRDVFAPAAAYLDKGVDPKEFGPEINDAVSPKFEAVESKDGVLFGEVLHVDGFGNVITNIAQNEASTAKIVKVNLHHISLQLSITKTYGQSKFQEPVALIGSHGFLELALNQGNFAEKYGVKAGDRIEIVVA
jgi:hypothetical protein